jgi:hypothetical protein
MKRLCAIATALVIISGLLSGAAVAQSSGGTGGSGSSGGAAGSGAGTSGTGSPGAAPGSSNTAPGSFNTTPNTTTTPGITTPSPSDGATTGRGPGVNPSNPQDMKGRSNPQDLTSPRAKNPQDGGGSVPRIMVPER